MARQKTKQRVSKSVKRKRTLLIPYPLVVFLLLCAGVYMVAWTFKVQASQTIKAVIHAQSITSPAVIDPTLVPDSHYTTIPIEIGGSCPLDAAYVEVFSNNFMSGTAPCINGVFDPPIDLVPGKNVIQARVFNATDDEGPVSAPIILYYDPPAASEASNPAVPPMLLKTSFVYETYAVGQAVEWPLEVSGGTPPYAVNIDWGDGTNDLLSQGRAGEFKVNHVYSKTGDDQGIYSVKIKATDSAGQQAYIQFFVNVSPETAAAGIISKPPPCISSNGPFHTADLGCSVQQMIHRVSWLWIAWPFYGFSVLMTLSFWLGERHESLSIAKKISLTHRRS